MKAIRVKWIGPTNTKGTRIKASADGWGSVTIPYQYEGSALDGAWAACVALLEKTDPKWLPKPETMVSGQLPNGDTIFCFVEDWNRHVWTRKASKEAVTS